jgi:RND family efflux transporter MFP subunit
MAHNRAWLNARRPALLAGLSAALVALVIWARLASAPAVVTVLPTRGDAAEVVYATGVVEPKLWAKVVALQRKRIVDICDCESKPVRMGDVLARLDDAEERAVLTELEARRATIADDVARTEKLVERSAVSRVSLDEKRTQLAEIDARIAAQKDRLYDLELRAPMTGVVLRRDGEVGEIAGTGSEDALFWVGQPKPLEVEAEVNEEDIAKVKVGQGVLLRHEGHTEGPLHGAVTEITPKGNPATKTFRVTLELPDDTPLMIGMSVEANIVVRESKGALLVPAEAVRDGILFTVRSGRAARTPVVTGIRGNRMIEIVSGLAPDARVVAEGAGQLSGGERVREEASAAP